MQNAGTRLHTLHRPVAEMGCGANLTAGRV